MATGEPVAQRKMKLARQLSCPLIGGQPGTSEDGCGREESFLGSLDEQYDAVHRSDRGHR